MLEEIEVRDLRVPSMFRVDDEYMNGYAKLCGTNATCVYILLCRHANKEQKSWPTQESIAYKLGISERTIRRALDILCEWKIIVKEQKKGKGEKWERNIYSLLDKKCWKEKTVGHVCPTEPSAKNRRPKPSATGVLQKDTHTKGYIDIEGKKNKINQNVVTLHDGCRAINKWGVWVDANDPNVRYDLSAYPELSKL